MKRIFWPFFSSPSNDTDVTEHAAIVVVDAVEDQGAGRGIGQTSRRRELIAKLANQLIDPFAGLGADQNRILGREAEHLLDFLCHPDRIGAGQVDLVDDRDDLQPDFDGGVSIGDGLGLHALRGIDDQDRPFAGLQAPSALRNGNRHARACR